MYTIIETDLFTTDARTIWDEDERGAFCSWLSDHPEAGAVRSGMGKQGGARVIYYNRLAHGKIYLLVIYAKNVRGSIPAHLLKAIKEAIGDF